MAVIEINKNPSKKELGWFGLLMAAFLGLVGLIVRKRFDAPTIAMVIWIAGVFVPLAYYALPSIRRPTYLGWLYATYPIGWVVSHVLLGVTYYLVFTPIGLLLRVLGKDPMTRRIEPAAESYWVQHRPCDSPAARYFRQY